VLHPRFQVAIDRAAKIAGMDEWGVYLEQWRKEQRPCSDDLAAEAEAAAKRLEAEYPKEVLNRLVETGGVVAAKGPGSRPAHVPWRASDAGPDGNDAEAPTEPTNATAGADARGGTRS